MAKHNYVVSDRCTRSCSLHHDNISFSSEALEWYNEGKPLAFMTAESEKLGRKLSPAALSRHRQHLDEVDEDDLLNESSDGHVDHLEVLQKIITAGAKRSKSWRVGPAETMKAMELYYRLTEGSAMESLFAKLTAVAAGESAEDVGEFDAGSLSPAEMEPNDADSE